MTEFMSGRIHVTIGDITLNKSDAIVNAANSTLLGGGGVDGAIHRSGGPAILTECKEIRRDSFPEGLPSGQAVTTNSGKLPSSYVIHTVGPVWHGGANNEDSLLADCYRNSLNNAVLAKCKSIAFPAISTGVYGFPKKRAAGIASDAVKSFLNGNISIKLVNFVFFSQSDSDIFIENQKFEI